MDDCEVYNGVYKWGKWIGQLSEEAVGNVNHMRLPV